MSIFIRQFEAMFNAAIPIDRCLDFFSDSDQGELGHAISLCSNGIQEGYSLSKAMRARPDVFPTFMIGLIKVGEETGSLSRTFERLAEVLERSAQLGTRLATALFYPTFLLGLFSLCFLFFAYGILPQMAPLLESAHTLPPWPTRVLLNVADLMHNRIFLIGLLALAVEGYFHGPVLIARLYQDPKRALFLDRLPLQVPILGKAYREILTARILFALSTSLEMGITLTAALELCGELVDNSYVRATLQQLEKEVEEGNQIGEGMMGLEFFPRSLAGFISSVEESGTLSDGLAYVALYNEENAQRSIEMCSHFIEPLMLAGLGVMGGFLVLAVMGPVLMMLQSIC